MSAPRAQEPSRWVAAAVAVAGVALAWSAPALVQRVVAAGLPLAALLAGPRLELGRVGQALASIGAMTAGVLLARAGALEAEVPELLSERTLLLGLPMILVAALRAALARPVYGARLTLVAALVALTAAGRAKTGWAYPLLAGAGLAAGLLALRASDPTRAPLRGLPLRSWLGAALGLAFAGGLLGAARVGLPRLQEQLVARMMARFQGRTGFTESMYLGSLGGLLQSDQVVLRVRGGAPPLLRGLVFLKYEHGRWDPGRDAARFELVESAEEPPSRAGFVELEHAGRTGRYFLPLGARDVFASSGFFDKDAFALYRPSEGAASKRVWFREGGAAADPAPLPEHLELAPKLRRALERVLDDWGVPRQPSGGAGRPGEITARIADELQRRHRYSLTFERSSRKDPVLDFLLVRPEGHCEYFASAFVLLARAAGVPAHLVGGYRVAETSPLGYGVVRERHAHAWGEAWVDGRWQTFDPTPAAELAEAAPSVTPWWSAGWDGLRTGWEVVDDWLARRTAFEFSLALVLMVGALVLVRALRGREPAKAQARDEAPVEVRAVLAALAARGVRIDAGDTLRTVAGRARGLHADLDGALGAYERLRYGGVGDEAEVFARLREVAAAVRG